MLESYILAATSLLTAQEQARTTYRSQAAWEMNVTLAQIQLMFPERQVSAIIAKTSTQRSEIAVLAQLLHWESGLEKPLVGYVTAMRLHEGNTGFDRQHG